MLCRTPALDLGRNNIGPVGIRALAESPLLEPLESLDLSVNVIGDAGLISLAQSPHMRRLQRLVLHDNRIGETGALALSRSRLPETLTHLDLTGNFVTADSIRAIDEAASSVDWRKKIEIVIGCPGLHLTVSGRAAAR